MSSATTVQLTNRFEDIGGAVMYLNRTNRWNWGVIVEQTPYPFGQFAQGDRHRSRISALAFVAAGAAAHADQPRGHRHHAVSVQPGAARSSSPAGSAASAITRSRDVLLLAFQRRSSSAARRRTCASPDPLNLGEGSAALVYDTSVFGATSPILGQRYRFEYTQSTGTLHYSGALVDYRKYFMARPLTLALRGMHYGRYGRDSEDGRLSPLFLGYAGLIRGYEPELVYRGGVRRRPRPRRAPSSISCIGSRMLVANVELRAPLIGTVQADQRCTAACRWKSASSPMPGVAWTSTTKPSFAGGDRDWARSVGATVRFNAFGFAVGEVDYVRPLDRPGRGWMWQFNLIPGF